MAVGRINLIDPIDAASKFGADYNGMPEYEKMRIFAELTVIRRGKSILVATDTVKVESDSTNVNINLLGFEQSKNAAFSKYHTTSWTNNTSANNNYEGFGIQSIRVNLTPSSVPIVNIDFVDIKGMSLINRGADSPYAVLYDFPPPIFELTIKGYYGKKLTYTLHLLEQNTRFDGTTGNYYISAKFTSRTFSPLTDILFKYAMIIPYASQETSEPLQLESSDIPKIPTNTFELIQSLKERNERLAKLNNTSEELETTKEAQLKITNIDALLSGLDVFSRDLGNYSANALIIIQNKDAVNTLQSKESELIFPSSIDAYNAYIKENDQPTNPSKRLFLAVKLKEVIDGSSNISTPASENAKLSEINTLLDNIADKLIDSGRDVFPSLTSGDKALITKAAQTDIPDNTTPTNSNTVTASYSGIDITKYYISLYNYRNKQKKSYDEAKAVYDEKANEITQNVLGFYPTPNNIFKIICDDVDSIFQNLRKVGEDGERHHEEFRQQIITSVNSNPNNKIPIGAFPFCFKQANATSTDNSQNGSSFNRMVRAFPSDIDQFRQLPKPFPEVNFVNNFINATIDLAKAELIENVKENTDVNGNTLWFPINPVDTTLKGVYSNESPFAQIERQRSYQLNKLYEIIINRFYIVSQYTSTDLFDDETKYVQLVAESDAINLAKSFIDSTLLDLIRTNAESHRNYTNFISYVSNPKNQVTNYNTVSENNTSIKFDNTVIEFFRSRNNINFVGFDYADTDLTQRVATDNSEDLVDKFLEDQTGTWTSISNSVINFFGGDKIEFQSFTKENLPYFPDIDSGNNELDSKFFDEAYVGFVDFWKWYFADDLPALTNIFSGSTYNAFQRAFIMISNMGRTRSFYHSKNRNKFSLGSGVEMPNYANLYMGLMALAYHPAITKPTPTYYSDLIDQIVNTLPSQRTGFFGKQNPNFFDRINWLSDKTKIVNLSNNDAKKLVNNFIDYFGNNGDGDDYSRAYNGMIDLINYEITDDENSEDVYGEQLLVSDFGTIHNNKIYILNYSDVTFSTLSRNSDPVSYIPLSNLATNDLARAQTYFNTFFTKVIKYIKKRNEEIDNIEKEVFSRLDDNDVKNQMYYSFKTIYDRWLPSPTKIGIQNLQTGFPLTGEPLINSFKFVDRAFNNIGDKVMLNVDSLIDFSKDFDVSVFQVMSRILSENGFEFFPVENFMIFDSGVNKWEDAFKITESLNQPSKPYFTGMYIGGTSSVLDNKNSESLNDGIIDLEKDTPIDFVGAGDSNDDPFYASVNAFKVKFGQQNQSFFTDIQFDQKEFTETNESLSILSNIAQDDSKTSPVPKGQNLFNVYSQRSYTAKVTGIGNAMIQPMQYFQVENVPMFRGAYMILSVEHNITANHMTTSFEGVRIANVPVPFVSTPFTSADYKEDSAQDVTQSVPVNTQSPNVVNDSNFSIPEGGLNYPLPSIKKSMENLFGGNGGVLTLNNTTNTITNTITSKQNLFAIGDSITKYGFYVDVLNQSLNYDTFKIGFPGQGTSFILNELKKRDLSGYNYISILAGINNVDNPTKVKADLQAMYDYAKSKGLKVIALTLTPFAGYSTWTPAKQIALVNINQFILSKPKNVDFAVDIYTPLADINGTLRFTSDQLHPDEKGHRIIAEKITENLR